MTMQSQFGRWLQQPPSGVEPTLLRVTSPSASPGQTKSRLGQLEQGSSILKAEGTILAGKAVYKFDKLSFGELWHRLGIKMAAGGH